MISRIPHPLQFLSFLPAGSSTPIVVQSADGRKYLVKLKGGQSGSYSYLNEWIAGRLGTALGLPVSVPETIRIDETLDTVGIHEEVKDLIHKSFGLNLAFPFFENAIPCSAKTARAEYDNAAQRLFAYDVFLQNTDRSAQNPNLLELDGRVFSFDYETSFLLIGIVQGKDFSQSDFVLQALRENPLFHQDLNAVIATALFSRLQEADIAGIVDSLPAEWAAAVRPDVANLKKALIKGLADAMEQRDRFDNTLLDIGKIIPENEADKKKRREANRARFEDGLIPIEILE
ncbi:MAG: hypothetical protein DYG98_26250 [Haliscomenobacteraceae bacterium CHB4]|nr:hypothetical protein [Saprospiraceae bacterium]MCE7926563.1 hypothetical protein [Haliscomenobacteraceae bacterium CHB4]